LSNFLFPQNLLEEQVLLKIIIIQQKFLKKGLTKFSYVIQFIAKVDREKIFLSVLVNLINQERRLKWV